MVKVPQRIILYGDSLMLAGVQTSLSNSPHLDVTALNQSPAELAPVLCNLHPDAIVFDLRAIQPDLLRSLLQQPGPLLIGIDPETHEATVLSAQQAQAETTIDLMRVILGERADHAISRQLKD